MADAARELIQYARRDASEPQRFTAYAPSNIALAKYWGKRDTILNLPCNSSLSISLGTWGTETTIEPAERDEVILNGETLAIDTAFVRKTLAFADLFRGANKTPLHISTVNTVPTAAGLASSASGFAALTKALCGTFALDLTEIEMSLIARLGSGSAARSFWHGFVKWNVGEAEDGNDSRGVPLGIEWPEFRIAILHVDSSQKKVSSRDGMNHTVETSPLFKAWPALAERDCSTIEKAIKDRDFQTVGETAEANALAMHATMQAARPSFSYLTSRTWGVLERLWQAREEGLHAYATMDAGPNVKLLFLADEAGNVLDTFSDAQVISPWVNA
ncbi:MAG: diphosphomevalonate decarboxylase [Pseudomonadota bacterium]